LMKRSVDATTILEGISSILVSIFDV